MEYYVRALVLSVVMQEAEDGWHDLNHTESTQTVYIRVSDPVADIDEVLQACAATAFEAGCLGEGCVCVWADAPGDTPDTCVRVSVHAEMPPDALEAVLAKYSIR